MSARRTRRAGRQIPEWLMLWSVFSFSGCAGLPLWHYLRLNHPDLNRWLALALSLGAGFLILVLLCALTITICEWFARKK